MVIQRNLVLAFLFTCFATSHLAWARPIPVFRKKEVRVATKAAQGVHKLSLTLPSYKKQESSGRRAETRQSSTLFEEAVLPDCIPDVRDGLQAMSTIVTDCSNCLLLPREFCPSSCCISRFPEAEQTFLCSQDVGCMRLFGENYVNLWSFEAVSPVSTSGLSCTSLEVSTATECAARFAIDDGSNVRFAPCAVGEAGTNFVVPDTTTALTGPGTCSTPVEGTTVTPVVTTTLPETSTPEVGTSSTPEVGTSTTPEVGTSTSTEEVSTTELQTTSTTAEDVSTTDLQTTSTTAEDVSTTELQTTSTTTVEDTTTSELQTTTVEDTSTTEPQITSTTSTEEVSTTEPETTSTTSTEEVSTTELQTSSTTTADDVSSTEVQTTTSTTSTGDGSTTQTSVSTDDGSGVYYTSHSHAGCSGVKGIYTEPTESPEASSEAEESPEDEPEYSPEAYDY